jgi:hypothetical protein
MAADPPLIDAVRLARPSTDLAAITAFYLDLIGMESLGGFDGHAGYDGRFVGMPGRDWHLEFTHRVDGLPAPAPTAEDLLVLYLPGEHISAIRRRLATAGHEPVTPENPYWSQAGAAMYRDPDGYLLVLCPTVSASASP